LILAIGCPFAGLWSDKLPRRPLLVVITCWLFVLTSYPAFYLMAAWPSLAACVIAVGWLRKGPCGTGRRLFRSQVILIQRASTISWALRLQAARSLQRRLVDGSLRRSVGHIAAAILGHSSLATTKRH